MVFIMDVLDVNWKVGAEFFKKILCVKLFGHQLPMPAGINVFLWYKFVCMS